jgi:hypothetical protein
VVVNLVQHIFDDTSSSSWAIVILDDGTTTRLLRRTDCLEGRETLNSHATTELLVFFIVTVDGSNLAIALELLGGFLVGRLEVLTVTAPRCIELNDLRLSQ